MQLYFPAKSFPPNIYRILKFVYNTNDANDNTTADNYTDFDDMYIAIVLASLH